MSKHQLEHPARPMAYMFLVLIALLYLFQLFLIPRANFNWDEFNELKILFARESGAGVSMFRQGMHYLFWPVRYLPLREDQLLTLLRYLTFLTASTGTYWLIYRIGREIRSVLFGTMAAFFAISFTTYFETVIQYRTDTFTTFFFLWAFYLVLRGRQGSVPWLLPGLLTGLALFINPKAAYHGAVLAVCYGLIFLARSERKTVFVRAAGFGLVTALGFTLLTLAHAWFYDLIGTGVGGHLDAVISTGLGKTHGWPFKRALLVSNLFLNTLFTVSILVGIVQAAWAVRFRLGKNRFSGMTLVLVGGVLELGTVLIHQGVYKYYIIDIFPLLAVLGTLPIYRLALWMARPKRDRSGIRGPRSALAAMIAVALLSLPGILFRLDLNLRDTTANQRTHIKYFHRIFPERVAYADGFGLISRYNNVLHFFSGKKFAAYRAAGQPVLARFFARDYPACIITSIRFPFAALLPEDQEYVKQHFIPYFGGMMWIYGRVLDGDDLKSGIRLDLDLTGPYRLSGGEGVTVDGILVSGEINLSKGEHLFQSNSGTDLVLSFGRHDPLDVVPNLRLPARQSGTFELAEPGRYYLALDTGAGAAYAYFDDDRLALPTRYEAHPSIALSAGPHQYRNRSNEAVSLQILGPLFVTHQH